MLAGSPIMAFVPTVDLERAREFYGGTLGLTVEEVNDFACVLRAGATMLRATLVAALTPQPFTVLGWNVEDMAAAVAGLRQRGVQPLRYDFVDQDELGVWTAPSGAKIVWFQDPDGNTLSLTQF